MIVNAKSVFIAGALLASLGSALPGGNDKKPVDECKEVKKEVQSLQEPKTRKVATAYCSQLLDLPLITEPFYVYETSTDFNLEPETYTSYTVTTLPPGTFTETDTVSLDEVTSTSFTTLWFGCPSRECGTGWVSSTLTMDELIESTTTVTRTITQSPNPLPKADPTKLSKACQCLSIPLETSTMTNTETLVLAPYTVSGPVVTWTDYQNIFLEIVTVTIPTGTTSVTIPYTYFPIFEYNTVYYPYPTVYVTTTIYPASVTPTPRPRPTRTPPGPTKTRCRTTRVHPPKPTKTKPPRKGGKGGRGGGQ